VTTSERQKLRSLGHRQAGRHPTRQAFLERPHGGARRTYFDDAGVWVALLVESSGHFGTHGPDGLPRRVWRGLEHLLLTLSRCHEYGAERAESERTDDRQTQLLRNCPNVRVKSGAARGTHRCRLAHRPRLVESIAQLAITAGWGARDEEQVAQGRSADNGNAGAGLERMHGVL
jgi:hypothetical protein